MNNNNQIICHHNICRHRGTRLCEKSSGKFSKSIQCGYHGWVYGLDGTLIGSPHMDAIKNFHKSNYGLHSVALKLWDGFIFINLSKAISLSFMLIFLFANIHTKFC